MTGKLHPPKEGWPRWAWPESGWWVTVPGTAIAVLLLIWPSFVVYDLRMRLLCAFFSLLLVPMAMLGVSHLCKIIAVAVRKMLQYDSMYRMLEQKTAEATKMQETVLNLIDEMTEDKQFEIDRVLLYGEQLYIVVKKQQRARLEKGQKIVVLDTREGGAMGEFEVTEERRSEYIARCAGFVSAIWLGFVRSTGKAECSPPPDAVAFAIPKENTNDE